MVRALHPESVPRVLVSDTVGFIENLPHGPVATFKSKLDEAPEASLLLHVIDAADPGFQRQRVARRWPGMNVGWRGLVTYVAQRTDAVRRSR